jgi:hypothetical protein
VPPAGELKKANDYGWFCDSGAAAGRQGHRAGRSCLGLIRKMANDYGQVKNDAVLGWAEMDSATKRNP